MKNLSLNQMENVEGGWNGWESTAVGCTTGAYMGFFGGPVTFFGGMAIGCVVGAFS
jgi:hypothetical protein